MSLGPDDRQAIAEAYWDGSRPSELADKYQLSEQHVLIISRRLDGEKHKARARNLGGRKPASYVAPAPVVAPVAAPAPPSQYGKTIGDQWVSLPYVSIQHGVVR